MKKKFKESKIFKIISKKKNTDIKYCIQTETGDIQHFFPSNIKDLRIFKEIYMKNPHPTLDVKPCMVDGTRYHHPFVQLAPKKHTDSPQDIAIKYNVVNNLLIISEADKPIGYLQLKSINTVLNAKEKVGKTLSKLKGINIENKEARTSLQEITKLIELYNIAQSPETKQDLLIKARNLINKTTLPVKKTKEDRKYLKLIKKLHDCLFKMVIENIPKDTEVPYTTSAKG